MTPSPSDLVALLLQLFDEDELRAFLRSLEGGGRLLHHLPSPPASLLKLADQTVDVLGRHGFLDSVFFSTLGVAFPRRRADIAVVAAAHGFPLTRTTTDPAPPSVADVPPSPSPPGTWDVYISYAQDDRGPVHTLATNLHELGIAVFLDAWEIGPGDVAVHRLDDGLAQSRAGLLAISAAALAHPWLMQEYAVLLTRSVERGQRLIPVVLDDAELPPMLASRHRVDLRGKVGAQYLAAVESIARALRGQRPGPPARRTGAPSA